VTTVPFKPTQGRPVLCRQCFKVKRAPVSAVTAAETMNATAELVAAQSAPAQQAEPGQVPAELAATGQALQA
jgi:hypothetical protein